MRELLVRVVVAGVLVWMGWTAGSAQSLPGRFELVLEVPPGVTRVTCRQGCDFMRSVSPIQKPQVETVVRCSGPARCTSDMIVGWAR
jgi:hypothetical protein